MACLLSDYQREIETQFAFFLSGESRRDLIAEDQCLYWRKWHVFDPHLEYSRTGVGLPNVRQ
jgi:hypothetical protein